MNYLVRFYKHLSVVSKHRYLVMKHCFKVGLYYQGLVHDLSKFSPVEFLSGVKYFQGYRSPISYEREVKGYSEAVLHHYGRNKHHIEYWMDYEAENGKFGGVKMPVKYVAESVCDRMAASKTYLKDKYFQGHPEKYYFQCKTEDIVHKDTHRLFCHFLSILSKEGEDACFLEMKRFVEAEDGYKLLK